MDRLVESRKAPPKRKNFRESDKDFWGNDPARTARAPALSHEMVSGSTTGLIDERDTRSFEDSCVPTYGFAHEKRRTRPALDEWLLKAQKDIPIRTTKEGKLECLKIKPIGVALVETTEVNITDPNTTVADVVRTLIDEEKVPKERYMLRLAGRILSPKKRIKDISAQADTEAEILVWNPRCPVLPNWSKRKDASCKRFLRCGEPQRQCCGTIGFSKHPTRPKHPRRYRPPEGEVK